MLGSSCVDAAPGAFAVPGVPAVPCVVGALGVVGARLDEALLHIAIMIMIRTNAAMTAKIFPPLLGLTAY